MYEILTWYSNQTMLHMTSSQFALNLCMSFLLCPVRAISCKKPHYDISNLALLFKVYSWTTMFPFTDISTLPVCSFSILTAQLSSSQKFVALLPESVPLWLDVIRERLMMHSPFHTISGSTTFAPPLAGVRQSSQP
jgi:hypothetical protein